MAAAVLPVGYRDKFKEHHEVDLAYSVAGLGRFRCNAFQQRGTIGMVFRVIPRNITSHRRPGAAAGAQEDLERRARPGAGDRRHRFSGKTTTLAAMIDEINATRTAHIMTIEDPIEYLHRDKKSVINQREIGVDTNSFSLALRSALRQDPDVILVGEMRDFETIQTALVAAETGHLVFSTLHTLDATETINRIIAVFPPHQQKQIRLQLASVLRAVVSQRLMPKPRGEGRVPAVEVLTSHGLHPRLYCRPRKDAPDSRRHRAGHVAVRDADVRPVDLQPLRAGSRRARRGAALGVERGRLQAEGPGHLEHGGDGARSDGGRGRGAQARDYEVWLIRPI